jgi:hypothetical protein
MGFGGAVDMCAGGAEERSWRGAEKTGWRLVEETGWSWVEETGWSWVKETGLRWAERSCCEGAEEKGGTGAEKSCRGCEDLMFERWAEEKFWWLSDGFGSHDLETTSMDGEDFLGRLLRPATGFSADRIRVWGLEEDLDA